MNNALKDLMLELVCSQNTQFHTSDFIEFLDSRGLEEEFSTVDDILYELVEEGTISRTSDDIFFVRQNHKTVEFLNSGGYTEQATKLAIEDWENEINMKKEREKLQFDVKLSKWQTRTFWPLFVIAVIGGILGAVSFFWQLFQ